MEREKLEVDVLFVGAGPANLAAAYHLARELAKVGREAEIAVIEKGQNVGDHILSGAIMDPRAMEELLGPDWMKDCPVDHMVTKESVLFLTPGDSYRFPVVPPTLQNHGNWIVSLSRICSWLKEKVEELGVMICEGYPGHEVLYDGDKVVGVRTMDMGLGPDGTPGPAFTPGTDIKAKITVFGEGSRGSLTKQVVDKLDLEGANPQVYGTGIKEIWDIPAGRVEAGEVWHTAGWPLANEQYGGSWMYAMSDTRVSIGFVSALDSGDPTFDPYETMQRWKGHVRIAELLEGGTLVKAGTKTVPEGGYWSRPKSYGAGFLIIGDSASLLNIARLKGIHMAVKSGMLAAEAVVHAITVEDFSNSALSIYERLFDASWIKRELWLTRNYRQSFKHGFWMGGLLGNLMLFTGGRLLRNRVPMESDFQTMRAKGPGVLPTPHDGTLTFDKVTGVYHAGAVHEEQQPSHLKIADTDVCRTTCGEEYGHPCEQFCPANVYEITTLSDGSRDMQINFSNCVHCKTCDIMDPYAVITWTTPSDAGGPKYLGM